MNAILKKDLYSLIDLIESRPGMYLGEKPTLEKLSLSLMGYLHGKIDADRPDPFDQHFRGFHDWTAERLGFSSSSMGWPNMILAITLGLNPKEVCWSTFGEEGIDETLHKDSMNTFFKLLREYREC